MPLTFSPRTTYPAGPNPISIAVADMNGDNKTDLVVADYGGDVVTVLLGTGGGAFGAPGGGGWGAPTTSAGGPGPGGAAGGPLTGDGRQDLAVADYNGGVSVLLGTGGGAFAAAQA